MHYFTVAATHGGILRACCRFMDYLAKEVAFQVIKSMLPEDAHK